MLALDYGSARCGCALSDPTGELATPLIAIPDPASDAGLEAIARLVDEREVDEVVVGLPVSLSGEEGPQDRSLVAAGRSFGYETAQRRVTTSSPILGDTVLLKRTSIEPGGRAFVDNAQDPVGPRAFQTHRRDEPVADLLVVRAPPEAHQPHTPFSAAFFCRALTSGPVRLSQVMLLLKR